MWVIRASQTLASLLVVCETSRVDLGARELSPNGLQHPITATSQTLSVPRRLAGQRTVVR